MTLLRTGSLLLFVATLSACGANAVRETPTETPVATAAARAHDNLNAVLWMQTAAEYEAAVRGTYSAALLRLDQALRDPGWSALPEGESADGFEQRPPAIIVDADETMIDNSPFQARGVRDDGSFEHANWQRWVDERRARALPGAVEFAREVERRGVRIYYVTNRDAPAETASTIANLRALGFPVDADAGNVLLRGDVRGPGREKSQRRRWVGARHRVLLLLGDNLGDFMDGVGVGVAERQALIARYEGWWGERWFMLPNPTYGSWEAALLKACAADADPTACKRSLMRLE